MHCALLPSRLHTAISDKCNFRSTLAILFSKHTLSLSVCLSARTLLHAVLDADWRARRQPCCGQASRRASSACPATTLCRAGSANWVHLAGSRLLLLLLLLRIPSVLTSLLPSVNLSCACRRALSALLVALKQGASCAGKKRLKTKGVFMALLSYI